MISGKSRISSCRGPGGDRAFALQPYSHCTLTLAEPLKNFRLAAAPELLCATPPVLLVASTSAVGSLTRDAASAPAMIRGEEPAHAG